jgi:hypothetical protein
VAEESPGAAKLIIHLQHSTAKPIEPGAKHEFDAWRGDALLNPPGLLLPVGTTHRLHHL